MNHNAGPPPLKRIWRQSQGILIGAIIGFFLGSNVDTAVHLHRSMDQIHPYDFDTPRVAERTRVSGAINHSYGNSSATNTNATRRQPSSTGRLLLSELTQNPPIGSLKCKKNYKTPIYDRVVQDQENSTQKKIPRIIHISYNERCVPTEVFAEGIQRWKDELPDYSVYFHDDDAVDRLLQQEWPEFPDLHRIMQCMKYGGAMKVDLWRMLVVYEFGGLYTDIDNVPASEFQQGATIHPEDTFFASSDVRDRPCQNVFAMEPKHPIAAFTIQVILKNLLELDSLRKPELVKTTGPHAFRDGYLNYIKLTNKKAKLKPGVYKGFMNKTIRKESDWNWLNPVGSEEVKYKKTVMSKKQRAHILGGLKHWKKVAQANRKGEDYSCREYLYRLDHATDEYSIAANWSLNRKSKLVP